MNINIILTDTSHPYRQMKKLIAPCLLCAATPVMGLDIVLDYTHDQATDQFFSSTPQAQAAVEKAAADLGSLLGNAMTEVDTDYFTGTNGSTQANLDWSWSYKNPTSGNIETIANPSIGADTVVIYAGTRSLSGTTLAQGGAGGAGVHLTGSGYANEWIDAVEAAEAKSNATMRRGTGPIVGTISGAANYGGYIGRYDLDFGVTVGNMWFDADTDDNGARDSAALMASTWHYDAYAPVSSGKTDFYSVALHEILHVMGAGSSQTWENLSNGSEWLGSEAALVAGTSNILSSDGAHLKSGLMSARISDGVFQEAILAPGITPGVRKELTEIDAAILQDLGYLVVTPVPEPSGVLLLGLAGALGLARRIRKQGL